MADATEVPHEDGARRDGESRKRKHDDDAPPAYYDISMLKPPVWTWEVSTYFFLGGLSAGAYALARVAERWGGARYASITRAGTAIAALAALPCSPLLIADLGDPKRFHHMMRVFKPASPMNLGSWVLTSCSALLALATVREAVDDRRDALPAAVVLVADSAMRVGDITALPLVLLLGSYTGILLSTTSTPVWSRNQWLGPLFMSSAMNSGATAIALALEVADDEPSPAKTALRKIKTAAHLAEAATLTGYLHAAGERAKPLTHGDQAAHFWGGVVATGLVVPELLERLPIGGKAGRALRISAAIMGLFGGFMLRWSMLAAGRPSANDPDAAREASRAD